MVDNVISLSKEHDRILNIVKAQKGFKNKSEAVSFLVKIYAENILEPQLRPEFIEKMLARRREKAVLIEDFDERFEL